MTSDAYVSTIVVGIALFASTNIDDIFLLSAFFADRTLAPRNVVLGQFLRIGVLTATSAAAAMASLVIPDGWTALLGLVPLALGIQKLWRLRSRDLGDEAAGEPPDGQRLLAGRSHSQMFAVGAVTIANGGDNLALYIPVFASSLQAIPLHALTFAVMTAVWCAAGYTVVNNALAGERIRRYGHLVLPVVLIAIGAWILRGASVLIR